MTYYPRMLPLCPDCLKKGKFKRVASYSKTCGPHKAAETRRETAEQIRRNKEEIERRQIERETSLDPALAMDQINGWFKKDQELATRAKAEFRKAIGAGAPLESLIGWYAGPAVQAEIFLTFSEKFQGDLLAMHHRSGAAGIIECVEYYVQQHTEALVRGHEWSNRSSSGMHNEVDRHRAYARQEMLDCLQYWEWDRIKERLLLWEKQQQPTADVTLGDYT